VVLFGDVAVLQMNLKFQQLLFQRSIVCPLFFRNFGNGVEDELDPVNR